MVKKEISIEKVCYPMPCTIVGANIKGKANFLAVSWMSRVNDSPPLMMVSLGKGHYTNQGIRESESFSINVPSEMMVAECDYCGMFSGRDHDKSSLFEVFYGDLGKAPMIKECPYNLECRLVRTIELGEHEMFIGEIEAAYSDERYLLDEDVPDLKKMEPFILSMSNNSYLGLGREIGQAWKIGKQAAAGV